MSASRKVKVSTPGRICLFGEHQDYLNLPVIAAAISLRMQIEGTHCRDNHITINMPDISEREVIDLEMPLIYKNQKDYFRSCIKVLQQKGLTFSKGIECELKSDIPINAGTSSSSAMVVSWLNFLAHMSDQNLTLSQHEIAELAYKAEVFEFNEAGGMMDQFSTSLGGVVWIESFPEIKTRSYATNLGSFVLGNSREPKDTQKILARVKDGVLDIVENLKREHTGFSLQTIKLSEFESYKSQLDSDEYDLLRGTIANRDITRKADELLCSTDFDEKSFGELLNEHHSILRDVQKISTPKIEKMIDASLKAGALGAKINGSGGGGCLFAYAPNDAEAVCESIKSVSEEAHIIHIDEGTRLE